MDIRLIFFLFLHKNICCGYSLEVPNRGISNEYPQHMFMWRNKKISTIFGLKKVPHLELGPYLLTIAVIDLEQSVLLAVEETKNCWMHGTPCIP